MGVMGFRALPTSADFSCNCGIRVQCLTAVMDHLLTPEIVKLPVAQLHPVIVVVVGKIPPKRLIPRTHISRSRNIEHREGVVVGEHDPDIRQRQCAIVTLPPHSLPTHCTLYM